MKITVDQIRKIIKEEMGQMTQAPKKPVGNKSIGRMLRKVPGQKNPGGGGTLPTLEYPKSGRPIKIGPLTVIFWMTQGDPDETIWANWQGPNGEGNDYIDDLESILEDALKDDAEEARNALQQELSDVRSAFGID